MPPEILRREIIGLGGRSLRKSYFGKLSAHARAYELERKRAEALAELDRAKTAFFSNVSHEFRTPLTLLLGPLEELLERGASALPAGFGELAAMAHRNGSRLMRLVNTLLDFSRIEAGRARPNREPTDLAALTVDLTSCFRSACEQAGLRLVVDCPPLPEPVHVDREMWEKIVLNLVSNAFKFTLEGEIAVRLRAAGACCELSVIDTGTGIAEAELPRIFERFHRVETARGRSLEGTGIGLALVQDLVKLHGGSVEVQSAVDRGSSFTVKVPIGPPHPPAGSVEEEGRGLDAVAPRARPYVEEAVRWLSTGDEGGQGGVGPDVAPRRAPGAPAPEMHGEGQPPVERPLVLLADDNADMREYIRHLLSPRFEVESVPDGQAALQAARRRRPALVLADVMMPRLDGSRLLGELRADPRLRSVPVLLLSARAGEESRVEGLEAGADDYLVKPFSAREFLARVTSTIELARVRKEAEDARMAQAAAEDAQRRSAVLARAGMVLSESLDYEETLANLSRLCVQSMVEWCVIDIVVEGGEIRRLGGAHADPAKEPLVRELQRRYPPRPDSPHPAARVLRTGEPLLLTDLSDEELRTYCVDDEHSRLIRELGTRCALVVPLVARGKTLGTMSLCSTCQGERWGPACIDLAQEVAHRAAMAIDNARLYREVQRADQRKSEFIAMLSHELRNPLAPIRTGLQLLRGSPQDSAVAGKAWEIVERQTKHLTRLVDDLLDVTRISHGKVELHLARLDLGGVVCSACDDLRSAFERAEVTLEVEPLPGPIWVEADAARLAQTIGNLLQNAAKFTPAGGRVTVEVSASGGCARVSVRDTGVGMEPREVERMFEPFAQAEQGLARTQGGLGLGLALAKGLVELHGGSIQARSEGHGHGSEFVVSLPLAPRLPAG